MNWLDKLKLRFRPFLSVHEMPTQFWYSPRFCVWLRRTFENEGFKFYGDQTIIAYFQRCKAIDERLGRRPG